MRPIFLGIRRTNVHSSHEFLSVQMQLKIAKIEAVTVNSKFSSQTWSSNLKPDLRFQTPMFNWASVCAALPLATSGRLTVPGAPFWRSVDFSVHR